MADDESHILELLTMLLEDLGAEVVTAQNGELALRAAQERRPALVITDVMMPKLRGDELCRRIKVDRELSRTPVVILSAVSEEELPESGADGYVGKPFDLTEIEALFRRHVGS